MSILPLLLLPVLMYFLLIRPQQRKMKAQQALLNTLAEGDEVMTSSGIYGFISAIDGDVLWLDIAGVGPNQDERIEIRVARAAVTRKITADEAADPADAGKDEAAKGDAAADS
ncbi:MAG TPA: preprotein translocase subunit YajC [Acidimicrobiales bacterium]